MAEAATGGVGGSARAGTGAPRDSDPPPKRVGAGCDGEEAGTVKEALPLNLAAAAAAGVDGVSGVSAVVEGGARVTFAAATVGAGAGVAVGAEKGAAGAAATVGDTGGLFTGSEGRTQFAEEARELPC